MKGTGTVISWAEEMEERLSVVEVVWWLARDIYLLAYRVSWEVDCDPISKAFLFPSLLVLLCT